MIRLRFGPLAFFLFVGLFALESWLFLEVGKRLGLLPVLAWVFISFVLGAVLIRVEGLRMLFSMHVQLQRGVVPAREMLATLAVVLGGLLLMLPGYFTDGLGLLLLFPPTRALLWFVFGQALVKATGMEQPERPMRRPSEEVIEVEAQRVDNGPTTR
jgi:UPF0716 protein FxsA